MSNLILNTDGGARGNPGPAAIGVVIYDEAGKELHTYKQTIGTATNNQAEYLAIIKALELVAKSKWHKENDKSGMVTCRLDSLLVVEQLNGNYKIKNEDIKGYVKQVNELLQELGRPVIFTHIPRDQNKKADKLVNKALDELKETDEDKC